MLYIHVPFCRAKCAYCDFYSTPKAGWMEGYVDALMGEYAERCPEGFMPHTLYLGGGTPSSLPLPLLYRVLGALRLPDALDEATIEANPEDVTPEWTEGIVGHTPFGRVSMGVQSFDDSELRFIGRRHTAADALRAVRTLRDGGVGNISLDLIYGLPGQTLDSWRRSLDTMLDLRPDHISAYLLSYEPRTRLGVMLDKGRVTEASDELVADMYSYLCRATREAGYAHYEISNFALPGRRAIHNSGYWSGRPYLGLGPGAHSYVGGVRGSNPPDLAAYIACGGRGVHQPEDEELSSRLNDLLITSLRTSAGLDPAIVRRDYPAVMADEVLAEADALVRTGELAVTAGGNLVIPEDKWLTSNTILLKLIIV